mgnify:CR=1 FL=1
MDDWKSLIWGQNLTLINPQNAKSGGVAVYLNTSICGGVDPYRVGTHCKILHFLGYPPFFGFLGGFWGYPVFHWFYRFLNACLPIFSEWRSEKLLASHEKIVIKSMLTIKNRRKNKIFCAADSKNFITEKNFSLSLR